MMLLLQSALFNHAERDHFAEMRLRAVRVSLPPAVTDPTTAVVVWVRCSGSVRGRAVTLSHLGWVRPESGHDLLTDGQGRLGAVNFYYATHSNDPVLIMARRGRVRVLTDFGDKFLAACRRRGVSVASDPEVVSVHGDTLEVCCTPDRHGFEYSYQVRISLSDRFSVVSWSRVKVI